MRLKSVCRLKKVAISPAQGGGVRPFSAYSPTNVLYLAHRGDAQISPENTAEAFAAAVGYGAQCLEMDCHKLSDSALGIMHDATVGRTTTSTGNVASLDAAGFTALTIDARTVNGMLTDTLHPVLLPTVLAAHKGKTKFAIEAKNAGSGAMITAALLAAGINPDHAMVQGGLSEIAPAIAAGYHGLVLANGTSAISAAQAAGVKWVGLASTEADATFAAWHAAGIKVLVYTVTRRWRRDQLLALGTVTGLFTNDTRYTMRSTPLRTSDDFASQVWDQGMFAGNSGATADEVAATARGRFFSPNRFGWSDTVSTVFVTMGFLNPVKGDNACRDFILEFTVDFIAGANESRWAAIWLAPTDRGYQDAGDTVENGYNLLMRKNGNLEVFRRVNGTAANLKTQTGAAIADGASAYYRITVGAAGITLDRLDAPGGAVTHTTGLVADTTHGCGNIAFGRAALNCRFSGASVR